MQKEGKEDDDNDEEEGEEDEENGNNGDPSIQRRSAALSSARDSIVDLKLRKSHHSESDSNEDDAGSYVRNTEYNAHVGKQTFYEEEPSAKKKKSKQKSCFKRYCCCCCRKKKKVHFKPKSVDSYIVYSAESASAEIPDKLII